MKRSMLLCFATALAVAPPVLADEGGVSFWLPGQFGSFAAAPGTPGLSVPFIYYHTTTDAEGGRTFPIGGRIVAGLEARGDLVFFATTWVFADPVAGGQASVGVATAFGTLLVEAEATLQGPRGNSFTVGRRDRREGNADLYPTASIKWNRGVHNFMAYTMAGIPVGAYDADRLANLGTNHYSLDGGGGYTYLDPKKGHEFSAVIGLTHNWENPDTDYKNGTDAHLDWAASQFFSEQLHVGLVGYVYQQVEGDSGAGATLGPFKSQVMGVGPQLGYFIPMGNQQKAYVNLKGIYEFDSENRADGWNAWVTVALPLGP